MIWKKQPVGSKLADLQNNKASKDTATQSAAGLMSASDKTKLDGIAAGATAVSVVNNLNSDSTTSALSAAQGKALNSKANTIQYLYGANNTEQLKTLVLNSTLFPPNTIRWINLRSINTTGIPNNWQYGYARVNKRTNDVIRIDIITDQGEQGFCFTINGGTSWSDWQEIAKKINCGTANSNNTLSVSMNNNERSIIVGIASHERRSFMGLVYVSGSGGVTIIEINKGDNITLTTGTNTMSVANSDTQDTYVFKMIMQ